MAVNLTDGAISKLSSEEWNTIDPKPVLQLTDIRIMQSAVIDNKVRYRFTLSDGSFHQQGFIATQHNELVTSGQLQKGSIVQLTEFLCNRIRDRLECDIIGDPKPFQNNLPSNDIHSTQRAIPSMLMPTYSSLDDQGIGSVHNPDTATLEKESEEYFKGHYNPKRSRTTQFGETFADSSIRCALVPPSSDPSINSGKTTIELNDLDRDMKKAVTNPDEKKKRSPTIDECYDKLKGLGLEATDPTFLAAFGIFSQPDNYRESWMTLPSDPEVLKRWIAMVAKPLGFMV